MEPDDQGHMEDVKTTPAISNTVKATNGTRSGVKAVFDEPLDENEPVLNSSQAQGFDGYTGDNRNNKNKRDGEYNAIDLDKATWSYLKRSCCLGTSLRHSEQAYLTFGENQIEDNHRDKSDDDEEEHEEDRENHKDMPPSHLAEYFEIIQKRFTVDKKIMEYERGTCWIEPPDPVFPLQSSADSNILLKPRLFIWAPNLLQPVALTCPKCKSQLSSQGWNKSPHARGVLDVDRSFFIMSTRFRCARCPVTLNAHDINILKQLPMHLQEAFPAYMTHRSAISKTLVDVMRPLMNIMSPKGFTRYLKEIHNARLNRLRVQCQKNLMITKPHGLTSDNSGSSKLTATNSQKKIRAAATKDVPQPQELKVKIQPILPNFSRSTPQFIPIYIPTSRTAQFIPPPPMPMRIAPLQKPTAPAMRPILPARRDINKHPALGAPSMMMRMPIPGIKRRITAIGRHRRPRTCKTCNSQVCPGRAQSKRCKFSKDSEDVSESLPAEDLAVSDTATTNNTLETENEQQASFDTSDNEHPHPSANNASSEPPAPVIHSPPSPVQETNDIPSPVPTSDIPISVPETSDTSSRSSEIPAGVTKSLQPLAQKPLLPTSSDKIQIPRLTYPVPSKRRPLRFTQVASASDVKKTP